MTTVIEASRSKKSCVVVKKGSCYLAEQNGEFALTNSQRDAIAFASEREAARIISLATCDTRNARLIGRSYDVAPIWFR